VIALPPSPGGVQLTIACPVAGVAVTAVGADGVVRTVGVTELEGVETGPEPFALEASTVNVYAVPGVRPLIVTPVAGGLPVTAVGVCGVWPM